MGTDSGLYSGHKDVWSSEGGQSRVILMHLLVCLVIFIVWLFLFVLLYAYYWNRDKNAPKPQKQKVTVTPHPAPRHTLELGKDLPLDFKTTSPTPPPDAQKVILDIPQNDQTTNGPQPEQKRQSEDPTDMTEAKDKASNSEIKEQFDQKPKDGQTSDGKTSTVDPTLGNEKTVRSDVEK